MTDAECFWQARRAIYLSGPMSSYPDNNYPLFMKVAAELRQQHHVYNPAEFPWENTFPIRKAFAAYCRYICEEADTIVLLPGFIKSVGVSAELALARNCGLEAFLWPSFDRIM